MLCGWWWRTRGTLAFLIQMEDVQQPVRDQMLSANSQYWYERRHYQLAEERFSHISHGMRG